MDVKSAYPTRMRYPGTWRARVWRSRSQRSNTIGSKSRLSHRSFCLYQLQVSPRTDNRGTATAKSHDVATEPARRRLFRIHPPTQHWTRPPESCERVFATMSQFSIVKTPTQANLPRHPLASPEVYRMTTREYERMTAAGVLDDPRVELLDGYVVKKMGKNPLHIWTVDAVLEALKAMLPGWWC